MPLLTCFQKTLRSPCFSWTCFFISGHFSCCNSLNKIVSLNIQCIFFHNFVPWFEWYWPHLWVPVYCTPITPFVLHPLLNSSAGTQQWVQLLFLCSGRLSGGRMIRIWFWLFLSTHFISRAGYICCHNMSILWCL